MSLLLDAATPVAVTGNPGTLTTASFTPPNGSVLYVSFGYQSSIPSDPQTATITDNLGSHLTYTQQSVFGNTTSDVLVKLWTAPVVTGAAMTVSVTQVSGASHYALLRVLVVTGADTSTPVGALGGGRGRTTNISGAAAQYASTRNNSWGWLIYGDWSASAVPTVPGTETVDASFLTGGQVTYANIKNNSTTATSGTTVTLTTSTPTSGLTLSWIYYEMLPAVTSSSPVGTVLLVNHAARIRSYYW